MGRLIALEAVVADLPTWPREDLTKLAALLSTLVKETGRAARPSTQASPEVEALIAALHDYLKRETGMAGPTTAVLLAKRGPLGVLLPRAVDVITQFATAAGMPAPLSPRDISLISVVYCQLVGQQLKARSVPLSWFHLLRAAETFPGLFDRAFPGYVANGLAQHVWKALGLRLD